MSGNSKKISDWLVDYGLPLAAWASAIIIAISLILWLIVALWLDPIFSQQKPAVVLDEAGVYVTVEMETAVAAYGRPIKLAFAIHNQSAITQTVSLTATTTSEQLLFTTPPRLSDITVLPQTMVTQTMAVANSSPNRLGASEVLSVTAVLAAGQAPKWKPLTIYSEGTWGRGLRQLVNSTVQQASPLIIVIAFLVPIFIQLVQHYIKKEQEKQGRAEKEAKQEQAKQQARRQKEREQQKEAAARQKKEQQARQERQIDSLLKALRNAILAGNLGEAKLLLANTKTIETSNILQQNSIHIAENLLHIVDLEPESNIVSTIQKCAVWPDECIAAFMAAWRKAEQITVNDGAATSISQHDWFEALKKARVWLPLTKVERTELLDQLAGLELEIIAWQKEQLEYKVITDWPKPPQTTIKHGIDLPFLKHDPLYGVNPFPFRDAHDDLHNLFSTRGKNDPAFWRNHPIFNNLFRIERSVMVAGASGSGRTALAYGLYYQAVQRNFWVLHIPGQPTFSEIKLRFSYYLQDFIRTFPIYLRRLTIEQRKLLAQFLVSSIPVNILLANIDAIRLHIRRRLDDLKEEIDNQLHLLATSLKETHVVRAPVPDSIWVGQIGSIAKAFEFERLFLVFDLEKDETGINWLKKHILPNIGYWQASGLSTIVFVPEGSIDKYLLPREVDWIRLEWTQEQLASMIRWRYKVFTGQRREISELFEENGTPSPFDYLLAHCVDIESSTPNYNPGKFFEIWAEVIVSLSETEVITKAHIDKAVKSIGIIKQVPAVEKTVALLPQESEKESQDRGFYSVQDLQKVLDNYFNLSEIHQICFDLGVDYENIAGPTKTEFARNVVIKFENTGRLSDLENKVLENRPMLLPKPEIETRQLEGG